MQPHGRKKEARTGRRRREWRRVKGRREVEEEGRFLKGRKFVKRKVRGRTKYRTKRKEGKGDEERRKGKGRNTG